MRILNTVFAMAKYCTKNSQLDDSIISVRVAHGFNADNSISMMYDAKTLVKQPALFACTVFLLFFFQYDSLSGLALPSKKTFNNMNKDFLEKRKLGLNAYLQVGGLVAGLFN